MNTISWEMRVWDMHLMPCFYPGYRAWGLFVFAVGIWMVIILCHLSHSLPWKKLLLLFCINNKWVSRSSEYCMVLPENQPHPHVGWEKECGLRVGSGRAAGSGVRNVSLLCCWALSGFLKFNISWSIPGDLWEARGQGTFMLWSKKKLTSNKVV